MRQIYGDIHEENVISDKKKGSSYMKANQSCNKRAQNNFAMRKDFETEIVDSCKEGVRTQGCRIKLQMK